MNRDVELQKIQVLSDYFQAYFSFVSSILVSGFIALVVVTLTLFYQNVLSYLDFFIALVILFVGFGVIGLVTINKLYDRYLHIIDNLLKRVEKGEMLPSIEELKKTENLRIVFRIRKERENQGF